MRGTVVLKLALIFALSAVVLVVVGRATAGVDLVKASQVVALAPLVAATPATDSGLTLGTADLRLTEWELSILPWYAREGITNDVRVPEVVQWYWAGVGDADLVTDYTFGIDAFTDCQPKGLAQGPLGSVVVTGPVWVNSHYINPADAEYQDVGYIFTLTHELAHDQGICAGPSDYVESSTQLAALEVAAAMANGGNTLAAASLLREWRDIVLGSMLYDALRTGTLPDYYAFLRTVVTPREYAGRMSRYRSRFRTAAARAGWAQVYRKYSFAVYVKAEWCLNGGTLAASSTRGNLFAPHALVPSGRPLVMDDFAYFVEHAGELFGP